MQRCSLQALTRYYRVHVGLLFQLFPRPSYSLSFPFVPRVRIRQALSKRRRCLLKGSGRFSLISLCFRASPCSTFFPLFFHSVSDSPQRGRGLLRARALLLLFVCSRVSNSNFPDRVFPHLAALRIAIAARNAKTNARQLAFINFVRTAASFFVLLLVQSR